MRTQIQFLMRTNFCYSTYGWTRWTKMQDSQVSNLVHPVYWNEYHGMDKPLYNRGRPAGCFPNSGYFIFLKYSCVHLKHTKRTSVLSKNLEIIEYGTIFSSGLRSSRDHKCSSESLHHPFKYLLRVKINLKVLKSIKCTKTPKIIMLITSVREMIFITLLVFQEKFSKKNSGTTGKFSTRLNIFSSNDFEVRKECMRVKIWRSKKGYFGLCSVWVSFKSAKLIGCFFARQKFSE